MTTPALRREPLSILGALEAGLDELAALGPWALAFPEEPPWWRRDLIESMGVRVEVDASLAEPVVRPATT